MIYIPDLIGEVVSNVRAKVNDGGKPYYMYGHIVEINNRLTAKNNDSVLMYKKYPLIILVLDVPMPMKDGIVEINLNMGILTTTKQDYNAEQRQENVLKPILAPLYDMLMESFIASPKFFWDGKGNYPPHTAIWRPYWGTHSNNGNLANIFNDKLDAIEITNLKLKLLTNKCK